MTASIFVGLYYHWGPNLPQESFIIYENIINEAPFNENLMREILLYNNIYSTDCFKDAHEFSDRILKILQMKNIKTE